MKNTNHLLEKETISKNSKTESIERNAEPEEKTKEIDPNEIQNPIKIKETEELTGETIDDSYEKTVEEEAEKINQKIDKEELDTSDFDTDVDDSLKDKRKKLYLS